MFHKIALSLVLAVGLVLTGTALSSRVDAQAQTAASGSAAAADTTGLSEFVGGEPPAFDDTGAVLAAFKTALEQNDRAGMARLLGLDPEKAVASDEFSQRFGEIKDLAAQLLVVRPLAEDRRILVIGREVWPFPFPIVQTNGKWAFDTEAGLEEVINRAIGENELMAISTARGYVGAQETYRATDWDGDGVPEYAQELISTPGTYDGLYWPEEAGIPESPAGALVSDEDLPAQGEESGYFGYRYRILKGQGDNVAGGMYDYVINGNMIAGFGLIARPVEYGVTGVKTFIVNQYGTVYEKDIGPDTARFADAIMLFDPDDTWSVVTEVTE